MFRNFPLRSFILLLGLLGAMLLRSQAQQKNEVGLVIGATIPPGVSLALGDVVRPPQSLTFNSSLALGVEYDRRFTPGRIALYGGVDFLASPLDVKLNQPPSAVSPDYAYVFLTPHVRVKFNAHGTLEPARLRTPTLSLQNYGPITHYWLQAGREIAPFSHLYLASHPRPAATARLVAAFTEAKSRPQLHSSAHHCQRLPSSLLIENASEQSLAPSASCPRHFRSRLTTFRPIGKSPTGNQ